MTPTTTTTTDYDPIADQYRRAKQQPDRGEGEQEAGHLVPRERLPEQQDRERRG